ncbi:MAG: FkbM family methyltransferase [Selenomonas ruminantium]|nr:FkbM family methyltransferase [Selenomonas ruminantium]
MKIQQFKERVVIFGAGAILKEKKNLEIFSKLRHVEIAAVVDNRADIIKDFWLAGQLCRVQVPTILPLLDYDKIVIFSRYPEDIARQLTLGYGLFEKDIEKDGKKWLVRAYLLERYADSRDKDIQRNLELLRRTTLDEHGIFGAGYIKEYSFDQIIWDTQENYPYVIVEGGKRIYYPNCWSYKMHNGVQIRANVYGEQQAGSPHLYCYTGHEPMEGDVLLDAGACEGNFTLRYIERVSKAYIVECDPVWQRPLELTFAPYKDKVVFVHKFLSDKCNDKEVTIDSLLNGGHLDFLKMDIEGAEERALAGARETLKTQAVKCSVCTYHTKNAAHRIQAFFDSINYDSQFSSGYMLFWEDKSWWADPDYRRGILYAEAPDLAQASVGGYVPYILGEKIRIAFIFQISSQWISWKTAYDACCEDPRFDVRLLLLREHGVEKIAMNDDEDFLRRNHIPYEDFDKFDLEGWRPHYVLYHTPYERGHRGGNIRSWSAYMRHIGARVAYIPYGLEFVDTSEARFAHFSTETIANCFRIYTMSEAMRQEYVKHCVAASGVRALGLPRHDMLYRPECCPLPDNVLERMAGRKLIVWKVHFPWLIAVDGKKVQVTPYLDEYLRFIEVIRERYVGADVFFAFLAHPKFVNNWQSKDMEEKSRRIVEECASIENVFFLPNVDYRSFFLHADGIMVDRSSLMAEAVFGNCPVLYMENAEYQEPLTAPIAHLAEGYHMGTGCEDMVNFVEMIRQGSDPYRELREQLKAETYTFQDGRCGERIKEDLLDSLLDNEGGLPLIPHPVDDSRIVIWGAGHVGKLLYPFLRLAESRGIVNVLGYVDNEEGRWGEIFCEKKVLSPAELQHMSIDYVVLAVEHHFKDLREQAYTLGFSPKQIMHFDELMVEILYGGNKRVSADAKAIRTFCNL